MINPPDDRMSDLKELFFESASELVEKLNEESLRLEKAPGDAETARRATDVLLRHSADDLVKIRDRESVQRSKAARPARPRNAETRVR